MPKVEYTVSATYDVEEGIITVTYAGRQKSADLRDSSPKSLARILLKEMLDDPQGKFSKPAKRSKRA